MINNNLSLVSAFLVINLTISCTEKSVECNERRLRFMRIDKGEWIDLKFHIKWSSSDNGFIQAWVNDNAFTDGKVFGSNMLNNASHYFKFGLYRNPTITYSNVTFYDDVAIY